MDDVLNRIAALLERATTTGDLSERLPREMVAENPAIEGVATALHQLFDKLWVQEFQLGAKREMLEKVLEIRTREVHDILDNVATGFLVARPDETVLPNYTRSCTRIFGAVALEGERLSSLMKLGEREQEAFSDAYERIFADVAPLDACVEQLPSNFDLGGRSYHLQVSPITTPLGQVTKLFVTVSDTTELRRVEAQSALRFTLLEILRRRDVFRGFLAEARRAIGDARAAPRQATLRAVLHTFAPHLETFGLREVSALVRSLDACHELTLRDLDTLEDALRRFLAMHRDVLGIDYDDLHDGPRAAVRGPQPRSTGAANTPRRES